MKEIVSPLNPDSWRASIGFASWQAIFVLLVIIAFIVVYVFYLKSKKQTHKKKFSFIFLLGILSGLILMIIKNYTGTEMLNPPEGYDGVWLTWESEVSTLLNAFTSIYFSLLVLIIPVLIFTLLVSIINRNRHNSQIGFKTFIVSFVSLLLMALIGVIIAFLLTPTIRLIEIPFSSEIEVSSGGNYSSIPDIINSFAPTSIAIFTSISVILSVVSIGMITGFLLRSLHKSQHRHGEKIIRFFENLQVVLREYIKLISLLLPVVIISRVSILFLSDILENVINLGFFFIVFLIGWALIIAIEIFLGLISMRRGVDQKENNISRYFKFIRPYWVESLTKVNSSSLLPYTINTVNNLNTDSEIAEFTPTLATTMGQSICGAFYPAFIAIMTANLAGIDLSVQFYIVLFIIIIVTNIGVTGVPGADSAVNLIVLGTLGLTSSYYASILLIEPFLDSIRTLGNATGFVAATLITSRLIGQKPSF